MTKLHPKGFLGSTLVLLGLSLAGGCAFLLDTDELKEGTGAAAGGSGGTGGSAGQAGSGGETGGTGGAAGIAGASGSAGAAGTGGEPPRPCTDAEGFFQCAEAPEDNPCTKDWCVDGACQRKAHVGQGMVPQGAAVRVEENQYEIGPLSLETDNANFYLGFWTRSQVGGPDKVTVRRHDTNPNLAATARSLDQVYPDLTTFYSSPALAPTTGGLRVAVAARSGSQDGMHLLTLKAGDLTAQGNPERIDFGSYNQFPSRVTAPRIGRHGTGHVVIWAFEGNILMREWTGSGIDFFELGVDDDVTNLVPINGAATQAFGAVAEAKVGLSEKLMVWKEGEASLAKEFDSASGTRLGLAVAAIEPATGTQFGNLVSWAHVNDSGVASLKLGAAVCGDTDCTAESFQSPGIVAAEGMRPALAVSREDASATLRRVAFLYAAHGKDPVEPSAVSALVLNLFQLDMSTPNAETPFEDLPYNPPISLVTEPDLDAPANPLESPFRSTAIAITPGGSIMMAWVYQEEGGPASLWIRRYQLATCTP